MASVSGLTFEQRIRSRDRAVQAAQLALAHKSELDYTQDATARWEGITKSRKSRKGEFPKHADCSSFATWCLWNGLFVRFHLGDIVNGQDWKAGFTGTMLGHGRRVRRLDHVRLADCVHYGSGETAHVTIIVGQQNGVPMVISFGSDDCPCFTVYNYRDDVREIRRYI